MPDHSGAIRRLDEFAGHKAVVFFYPRADTPGCTTEAQDFTARSALFAAADTAVVGISADAPRKLARFREKHALTVDLLADESQATCRAYGVWGEKSMYGKTFEGIVRSTFLIGPDGKVLALWRNVKVPDHAETVLTAARRFT
jgi:peroxiredoxin Q/BCP